MPSPHRSSEFADALYDLAESNGVTHFGTLKLGLIGRSKIDLHRELLRPLAVVFRTYGRDRSELSKRSRPTADHLPFLVGVVERYDRAGSLDPHLHYFIRLRLGEEPHYRGFLRARFGRDHTKGAEGLAALTHPPGTPARMRFFRPDSVCALSRPGRPLITRPDATPTFDLQPLRGDWRRAISYSIKQSSTSEIISHLDLLKI